MFFIVLLTLGKSTDFMDSFYILYSVLNLFLFGIWYLLRYRDTLCIERSHFRPLKLLGILFLIPGTQYLSAIVTAFVSLLFPAQYESYLQLMETSGILDETSLMMMLYTVILAPITEELIFRGVTFQITKRTFPFWIANFIQAVFFGIFHFNLVQGIYTFVLALFLGYICEKTSLYHSILFHILFNLWGVVIAEHLLIEDPMLQGLFIIVSATLGITLGLSLFRKGNRVLQEDIEI